MATSLLRRTAVLLLAFSLAGWQSLAMAQRPTTKNFGGNAYQLGRYTVTADGQVGTTIGRYTFFDSGLVATRVGTATAYNNGLVSAQIGRNTIFSNGVVGVPTRGGMVFTPGFEAPQPRQPRGAARHHAGHPSNERGNR
ncbi:MAG: hypothetical protein DWH79_07490 [Planctomycetota bacterium]|nr:MAG: hypothetical protein DWH79_07490 [Planctomycetota bacterium]